jgi:hypothetical protein
MPCDGKAPSVATIHRRKLFMLFNPKKNNFEYRDDKTKKIMQNLIVLWKKRDWSDLNQTGMNGAGIMTSSSL